MAMIKNLLSYFKAKFQPMFVFIVTCRKELNKAVHNPNYVRWLH